MNAEKTKQNKLNKQNTQTLQMQARHGDTGANRKSSQWVNKKKNEQQNTVELYYIPKYKINLSPYWYR